uniref:Uncharacterized protein n=1 Tax=Odontella aurita TaxID=265563 RepID=A0A7S4HWF1_9STRA
MDLSDESILERCEHNDWYTLDRGDYIVRVHGNSLTGYQYLCHSITFVFASGQEITFESHHMPWKGSDFSFEIHQPGLVQNLEFKHGSCVDVDIVHTTAHLPIVRGSYPKLLAHQQENLRLVLLVAKEIDRGRTQRGEQIIGADVWWRMLEKMLTGFDLIPKRTASRHRRKWGHFRKPKFFSSVALARK